MYQRLSAANFSNIEIVNQGDFFSILSCYYFCNVKLNLEISKIIICTLGAVIPSIVDIFCSEIILTRLISNNWQ